MTEAGSILFPITEQITITVAGVEIPGTMIRHSDFDISVKLDEVLFTGLHIPSLFRARRTFAGNAGVEIGGRLLRGLVQLRSWLEANRRRVIESYIRYQADLDQASLDHVSDEDRKIQRRSLRQQLRAGDLEKSAYDVQLRRLRRSSRGWRWARSEAFDRLEDSLEVPGVVSGEVGTLISWAERELRQNLPKILA